MNIRPTCLLPMDENCSKAIVPLININKITVLSVSVVLTACAGTPVGTEDTPDAFAAAALSWEGSHIREMIAVWGRPNDAYTEKAKFSDGYGRWKDDATESGCIDAYPVRQTRVCHDAQRRRCEIIDKNARSRDICERKYKTGRNAQLQRCIVTATFDEAGTITEIDVFSRRCSKVYAENLPFLTK